MAIELLSGDADSLYECLPTGNGLALERVAPEETPPGYDGNKQLVEARMVDEPGTYLPTVMTG